MGIVVIPTGKEDEPFIMVRSPYIETTNKQRKKVLRNLEIITNNYLRERIMGNRASPAAREIVKKPTNSGCE